MAGPLKTLFQALQASAFMSGVSLAFGEEMKAAQDQLLPYVVMVPLRGTHSEPGYANDGSATSEDELTKPPALDPYIENAWELSEQVQFFLWNRSTDVAAQNPIDHADSIETLRLALLSALRDQTAQTDSNGRVFYGLAWKSLGEEWELMSNAVNRFGRALVVTVQIDVPVVMAPPAQSEVVVETEQFNPTINNAPG